MPVSAGQEGGQSDCGAVALHQRGDVAVQEPRVARVLHESGEEAEVADPRAVRPHVEIHTLPHRSAVGDDHAHAVVQGPAEPQRIAEVLPARPGVDGAFVAGVGEERHAGPRERRIEVVAARSGGVDAHGIGQPLHRPRSPAPRRMRNTLYC